MLDAIILEKAGIPAISIVTDAFESTAKEMAELWAVPDFRFVMIPHPLAYLTPEDVERRADELLDEVLGLLQEGQPDSNRTNTEILLGGPLIGNNEGSGFSGARG